MAPVDYDTFPIDINIFPINITIVCGIDTSYLKSHIFFLAKSEKVNTGDL